MFVKQLFNCKKKKAQDDLINVHMKKNMLVY